VKEYFLPESKDTKRNEEIKKKLDWVCYNDAHILA
jgi:hypothetical protein